MGIVAGAKGEFLKVALDKLTHGDTGSTALGVIAAGVLASGANLSDLFSADQTKQAHAAGMIAGSVVIAIWGWKIGKPKKPTESGSTPPPRA